MNSLQRSLGKVGFDLSVLLYVILYIVIAAFRAAGHEISGDTFEYYYTYSKYDSGVDAYGVEFVVPLFMAILRWAALDFRCFLFLTLLVWLPPIIVLARLNKSYWFAGGVFAFFLTPMFTENALFLIRQYWGLAFFFLGALSLRRRTKLFMYLIAVCCHLSIVFVCLLTTPWIRRVLLSKKALFVVLGVLSVVGLTGLYLSDILIELIPVLLSAGIAPAELERKMMFYAGDNTSDAVFSLQIAAVNMVALLIYMFSSLSLDERMKELLAAMLGSSLLMILFMSNPIMANRVGVLGYFFSIPFLLVVIWNTRIPRLCRRTFYR